MTSIKVRKDKAHAFCVELRDAIGANKVKDDDVVLVTYASDVSPVPFQKPGFVVLPENKEDVIQTLKLANKYGIPITVAAGGTNVAGYCVPSEGGIVLDMRRMDKIIEINTDSGYAVIEAGVLFDHFTSALREKGYRCAVPTSPGSSSPLGNYLGRPANSLVNRHLDPIVDLEVVLADGTVFSTGSSHFTNAGSSMRYGPFPDLAGLFTCSYGTMGIITRATIKIYPINESNRVNVAAFDTYSDAIDFVKDLINNNIPEHCIIWNWQFYESFGVDTSIPGIKIPPILSSDPRKAPEGVPYCIVTSFLSGYEEMMVASEKVCAKVAKKYNGKTLLEKEIQELIPKTRDCWDILYSQYHSLEPTFFGVGKYMSWIMLTEPKDVKRMESYCVGELAKMGMAPVCYYSMPFDFGRSIFFRIFCFPDAKDQALISKVSAKFGEMFDVAMKRYGAVPMRHKPTSPCLDETGGFSEVLSRIQKSLDPNNILNRNVGMFKEE